MNKGRVEAFSDGVFAFAITLLVVTIAQPDDYRHLAHDLGTRWPSLAAYMVSFAIIGIMWLNHHSVFAHFARVDRGLVYFNLMLLMTVAFLPYPTGVLGQALARGAGERAAAVVYGTTMTANALAWTGLWLYASHGRRLLTSSFPESERRTATLLFNAARSSMPPRSRSPSSTPTRSWASRPLWPFTTHSTRCRDAPVVARARRMWSRALARRRTAVTKSGTDYVGPVRQRAPGLPATAVRLTRP